MPSTEDQVKNIVVKYRGRASQRQIARELNISLGYLHLIGKGLEKKGKLISSGRAYILPAGVKTPTSRFKFPKNIGASRFLFTGFLMLSLGTVFVLAKGEVKLPSLPPYGVVSQAIENTDHSHAPQNLIHSDAPAAPEPRQIIVTFYSSDSWQTDDTPFITANGIQVRDGIAAANFLPFGTQIKLPELYGDKMFTIEDRMHPRFPDRIDVWVKNWEEALQRGIYYTTLEVHEPSH